MKSTLILLFVLTTFSFAKVDYYGAKSTEALLTFDGTIQVETSKELTVNDLNGNSTKAKEIRDLVDYQLSFLIGHFQSPSFLKKFRWPGVLGDDQNISFTGVGKRIDGRQILTYNYSGKTNFHSDAFGKSKTIEVPLRIPFDPYKIFELGLIRGKNKCTDDHYNSEGDLFYFWDPEKPGCPLKKNKKDVLHITGSLEKLANTVRTYPEYDRLYSSKELRITVLMGYIADDPFEVGKKDEAYKAFKKLSDAFESQGYLMVENKSFNTINHLRRFEKDILNQLGNRQKISIHLLLSDSSLESNDITFIEAFSSALRSSQIVAYDGHSGLGGNLNIDRFGIERLPSFYQIFFFNGCSSYPYFNNMFFTAKPGGKKNLEIITSGLPTLTSTTFENMMAFLDPFMKGKLISYQTLMHRLEDSNGEESTYLMGVNGDEDNKWKPDRAAVP